MNAYPILDVVCVTLSHCSNVFSPVIKWFEILYRLSASGNEMKGQ